MSPDFQQLPFVTIILPIRNEADFIARGLGAVFAQDYSPERMEILIADGMSTDETRNIIEHLANIHPKFTVKVLDNPAKIVPTGMNIALRQAKGEIIIRVDGHCIIAPDYVSKCVSYLLTGNTDGVGGPMQTIGDTFISSSIAVAMSSKFGVGNSSFRTESGATKLVDSVPFPAYTRSIIELTGLYDEELIRNQDDEYNYRIRALGGKILLVSDIHSKYYSRGSLSQLARQYFQYGFWKVRVLQKHPRQMSLRQFVPPVFVTFLIGLTLLSVFYDFGRASVILAINIYVVANLGASTYCSLKTDIKYLFLLPFVFAILHFSYGFGFLTGLIYFGRRWGDSKGKAPDWLV